MSRADLSIQLSDEVVDTIAERAAALVLQRLSDDVRRDRWPAYMNVATAAEYLDVAPERIRKLVQRRAVPFIQEVAGGRILFCRTDLDKWMASSRHAERGDA